MIADDALSTKRNMFFRREVIKVELWSSKNENRNNNNNHVSQAYIGGTWDGGVIFASVWVYCKIATELE